MPRYIQCAAGVIDLHHPLPGGVHVAQGELPSAYTPFAFMAGFTEKSTS